MKLIVTIIGMIIGLTAGVARATLVTFDDLPYGAIRNGYAGFNWVNWNVLNAMQYISPSGYQPGTLSIPNVSYNAQGSFASFGNSSGFTINSLFATAAWQNNLNVTFFGYDQNGVVAHTLNVSPSAISPTFYEFNWSNIYQFGFSSSGGTQNPGYLFDGSQVAIDDITVDANVPTPATIALLVLGIVGIGVTRSRPSLPCVSRGLA